ITAGRVAISVALSEIVLPLCQCYHVDGRGSHIEVDAIDIGSSTRLARVARRVPTTTCSCRPVSRGRCFCAPWLWRLYKVTPDLGRWGLSWAPGGVDGPAQACHAAGDPAARQVERL